MGKVILDMSVSLDGFIAGPNDEDMTLHNWYFSSEDSRNTEIVDGLVKSLGAIIMGRRSYDLGDKQDGFVDNPYDATNVVLSHTVPARPAKGDTKSIFVSDGIKSALEKAKAAADNKDVAIGGGANVAQQYLKAGLIDEIHLHIVPILIGEGIRLFEHLGGEQIKLEKVRVIDTPDVTHLYYRVVKS
jgi:dihydrofolate reductase